MTEQHPQAFNDPAKPDPPPPIIREPDSRADADRKKSATLPKRPRRFPDGKKTRKKNAQGILAFDVHVVSARYDEKEKSWMYTLEDWQQNPLPGETEETKLG